jgi:hypothetical protein
VNGDAVARVRTVGGGGLVAADVRRVGPMGAVGQAVPKLEQARGRAGGNGGSRGGPGASGGWRGAGERAAGLW